MSNVLTASELLKSIRRRAFIPTDQQTFTDTDLLDMATEEMNMFMVPFLIQSQEEYLVVSEDELTESNKMAYKIPYRALGNKLRELQYVDNDGNIIAELSRISMEQLPDYKYNFQSTSSDLFYLQNNKIMLVNAYPGVNVNLRKYFYLRPNNIVEEKFAGKVQAIDTVSGTVTLEEFPTNFASSPKMDFVAIQSPNVILAYDKTPTSVNSNTRTIVFNPSDLPEDLIVGDYICEAQQSVVPQLPAELHPILAQRVAVACLEALGDEQGKQSAERQLVRMEKSVDILIDDRVEGAPQKINNRHGTLNETRSNGYTSRRRGKI